MEPWPDIPEKVENAGQLAHNIPREYCGDARTTISQPNYAKIVGVKKSVTSQGVELWTYIIKPMGGYREVRACPVGTEYARQLEAQRKSTDPTGSTVGFYMIDHPDWEHPKYHLSTNNLNVDAASLRRNIRDGTQSADEAAMWLMHGEAIGQEGPSTEDQQADKKALEDAIEKGDETIYGTPSPRGGTIVKPQERPEPSGWKNRSWWSEPSGYGSQWDWGRGCWRNQDWNEHSNTSTSGGQSGQDSKGQRRRTASKEDNGPNKHHRTDGSWTGVEKGNSSWEVEGGWQLEGGSSSGASHGGQTGSSSSWERKSLKDTATYSGGAEAAGGSQGDLGLEDWQRVGVERPWADRLDKYPNPKPQAEALTGFFNAAVQTLMGDGRKPVTTEDFVRNTYYKMDANADAGVVADRIANGRSVPMPGQAYSEHMKVHPESGLLAPIMHPDRDEWEDGGHHDWDHEKLRQEHPVLPHRPSSGRSVDKTSLGHLYECTDPDHYGARQPKNLFKILPMKVNGSTLNV